jgi:hypothetical protein
MTGADEMEAVALPQREVSDAGSSVLTALRELRGRATVGDIVAATGLSRDRAEVTLRELLESYRGHLAVGQEGDLVYDFDRKLLRRDHTSWWSRFRRGGRAFLKRAFKVWIMLMLVLYFVIFVALVIAAIVAMMSRNEGDSRRRDRGGFRIPWFWIWYMFWTPRWHYGQPYYGSRWAKRTGAKDEVPFYKKVFAFVFGPDEPKPTQEQLDREKLRLIRARDGVLSTAELIQQTGQPVAQAEEDIARLTGAYAGDVRVTRDGELAYIFPELMVSAHGRVSAREPRPAWQRLEVAKPLTGNEKKTDLIIAGLNGFTLVAAATAPWFIFPRLGLGGPVAEIGLIAIPVVFSTIFYAIPFFRKRRIARENAARTRHNIRKVLLNYVFDASLQGGRGLTAAGATEAVRALLERGGGATDLASVTPEAVAEELQRMSAEFDAEVDTDEGGAVRYRFPAIRRQFEASAGMRASLALQERGVGDIVYSSDDSDAKAGERALRDFDRSLQRAETPRRIGYMDDFEAIEFDEELARIGGGSPALPGRRAR